MLFATDIDGTLVPPGVTVPSPRTVAALERADAAGVAVVFVTARPLRWMDPLWPHVGRHGRAIVSNGAVVYDVPSRRSLRLVGLAPAAGLALVEAIRAAVPGSAFAIEDLGGMRLEAAYDEPDDPGEAAVVGPLDEVWTDDALKLLVRHDGRDGLDAATFHDRVAEAVGSSAICTWSTPGLVEISAGGVTKATALAWLAGELGVDASEVVAIGDMPNDVPMLTWAGTAYAVADAHPDVLAVADHVAPACEDDGVATVLESLLP
jgi:Cof subfamily protein (haloacid dehalogenase superfamily)